MFREQVYVQVEIIALVRHVHRAVLAYQHECREENGFHGSNHRKHDKGRIEVRNAWDEIGGQPCAVKRHVQLDKPHTAREIRDGIRDFFFSGRRFQLLLPAGAQGFDVSPQR
jgi:hypothetical protein